MFSALFAEYYQPAVQCTTERAMAHGRVFPLTIGSKLAMNG